MKFTNERIHYTSQLQGLLMKLGEQLESFPRVRAGQAWCKDNRRARPHHRDDGAGAAQYLARSPLKAGVRRGDFWVEVEVYSWSEAGMRCSPARTLQLLAVGKLAAAPEWVDCCCRCLASLA